jgi:hypothetical protein
MTNFVFYCIATGPVDDWNRLLYHEIGRSALEQYQDEASKHQLNQV